MEIVGVWTPPCAAISEPVSGAPDDTPVDPPDALADEPVRPTDGAAVAVPPESAPACPVRLAVRVWPTLPWDAAACCPAGTKDIAPTATPCDSAACCPVVATVTLDAYSMTICPAPPAPPARVVDTYRPPEPPPPGVDPATPFESFAGALAPFPPPDGAIPGLAAISPDGSVVALRPFAELPADDPPADPGYCPAHPSPPEYAASPTHDAADPPDPAVAENPVVSFPPSFPRLARTTDVDENQVSPPDVGILQAMDAPGVTDRLFLTAEAPPPPPPPLGPPAESLPPAPPGPQHVTLVSVVTPAGTVQEVVPAGRVTVVMSHAQFSHQVGDAVRNLACAAVVRVVRTRRLARVVNRPDAFDPVLHRKAFRLAHHHTHGKQADC